MVQCEGIVSLAMPCLNESISSFSVNNFSFTVFCIEIAVSKYPDHFAGSELGLYCLHMSPKQVSSLKRVKHWTFTYSQNLTLNIQPI